jgi:hypothetical protein
MTDQSLLAALRGLLAWRRTVNAKPALLLPGLTHDPQGVAAILFNGPAWDMAEDAVTRRTGAICPDVIDAAIERDGEARIRSTGEGVGV